MWDWATRPNSCFCLARECTREASCEVYEWHLGDRRDLVRQASIVRIPLCAGFAVKAISSGLAMLAPNLIEA
jgi:hypothetical protein